MATRDELVHELSEYIARSGEMEVALLVSEAKQRPNAVEAIRARAEKAERDLERQAKAQEAAKVLAKPAKKKAKKKAAKK